ncbi:ScbR family autoregulator-binding transcription factor [Arthrobacter antioxidans]|uniref:ScbR family autoregulator-binding transcription factor n=1 Tax=Arthrobacter antioxidans TaxID=2895818 RepID=UPI001FFEA735|nr:ScbR family autoregulator-binding transcription factor [Arthrobacter antioxidans]
MRQATLPPARQQARARSTRSAIILAAAGVFEEHGYGNTSLAAVASAAEVTKGALYFHFASKDALAVAVIEEQHAIASADGARVQALGRPALETMVLICRGFTLQLIEHSVMRAGIRLTFEASAFGHDVRRPYVDWAARFGELARMAQQDGDLRPDLDSDAFAQVVVGSYTGVQMVSNVLTGRADVIERLADLWQMLLPGVVGPDRQERVPHLVALFRDGPSE